MEYPTTRKAAKEGGYTRYTSTRPCPQGHIGFRSTAGGGCVICSNVRQRSRGPMPSDAKNGEYQAKWNASPKGYRAKMRWKERDPKNAWACSALGGAKARAKKFGLPFDIDKDYIRSLLTDTCPVFGIPFVWYGQKLRPDSPSLDRVLPNKGYVRGNIAIISQRANAIKSDASASEVRRVADWMESFA